MDSKNPIVKIEHLKFNYRKHIVFEDLSLELEAGRIYGLLGENLIWSTGAVNTDLVSIEVVVDDPLYDRAMEILSSKPTEPVE